MSLRPFARICSRNAFRARISISRSSNIAPTAALRNPVSLRPAVAATTVRDFHHSKILNGMMPESENPPPKESEANEHVTAPTEISTEEYNQRADEWLEELVNRLEQEQEKRQDLDVEYAAGVLEISIASKGTYVLNKQPPNKQIWLSSPISGPKRFDWAVTGESMHQKEGGGVGDWIYLRDGSSLTELVRKEIGIELGIDKDAHE